MNARCRVIARIDQPIGGLTGTEHNAPNRTDRLCSHLSDHRFRISTRLAHA